MNDAHCLVKLRYLSFSYCSAVFTSNKLLVVVAEMRGDERDALDMVPVITTALLEEHQLVTGIVVIVDPGGERMVVSQ